MNRTLMERLRTLRRLAAPGPLGLIAKENDMRDLIPAPAAIADGAARTGKTVRPALAAAVLSLLLAAGSAAGAELRSPDEVRILLESAGYAQVDDIEYDDGLWEAEATRSDGRRVDLHVDPLQGEVLDAADGGPWLTLEEVSQRLQSKGYSGLHDAEREDGLWELDAVDPQGRAVELRLSARDGRILHSQPDHDD